MLSVDTPVILSTSGKGGTGKTLVTCGLSSALAARARVGIIDLDIRSPNLTYVLGMPNTPEITAQGAPIPIPVRMRDSVVPVFSTAMMFREGGTIVTKGGQVSTLIANMLRDVQWPVLDYLVADMDPSTGDSLRTITEVMRHVSAFVVTTSDISSLSDCRRMIDACDLLDVKILGVVANMVGVVCPSCESRLRCTTCGETVEFGDYSEVSKMADEYGLPVVASLPWNPKFKKDPRAAVETYARAEFVQLAQRVVDYYGRPKLAQS